MCTHKKTMLGLSLYTVGHSNRSLEALIELIADAGVVTLVDVRAHPASRRWPHFDHPSLRHALDARDLAYHWAGRQLGGMRCPRRDSRHIALEQDGLRGYADHMESEPFRTGAAHLMRLATGTCLAVMCAERDPAHCHRSLLADYLVLQGVQVIHLLDTATRREHLLSDGARRESAELIYDRRTSGQLFPAS